ncbi:hypothetical protein EUTSA_v10015676mg [Eutrema salsugineum]|uniref:F-box associated beta-propeller type 3 domain-containing protein n=1 Tax=Eutrema salsugineum TaxID=72664 RepID=V4N743_EUTSA|nr:hypothetical protein EUTSA_v10015676mg [Eutrema salsugineum]
MKTETFCFSQIPEPVKLGQVFLWETDPFHVRGKVAISFSDLKGNHRIWVLEDVNEDKWSLMLLETPLSLQDEGNWISPRLSFQGLRKRGDIMVFTQIQDCVLVVYCYNAATGKLQKDTMEGVVGGRSVLMFLDQVESIMFFVHCITFAFYVARKGDIVGVYRSFRECQEQAGSSVCHLSMSVYKGYGWPKGAEELLASFELKNALFLINASHVKDDVFGKLIPFPLQHQPSSSQGAMLDKPFRSKRLHDMSKMENQWKSIDMYGIAISFFTVEYVIVILSFAVLLK